MENGGKGEDFVRFSSRPGTAGNAAVDFGGFRWETVDFVGEGWETVEKGWKRGGFRRRGGKAVVFGGVGKRWFLGGVEKRWFFRASQI